MEAEAGDCHPDTIQRAFVSKLQAFYDLAELFSKKKMDLSIARVLSQILVQSEDFFSPSNGQNFIQFCGSYFSTHASQKDDLVQLRDVLYLFTLRVSTWKIFDDTIWGPLIKTLGEKNLPSNRDIMMSEITVLYQKLKELLPEIKIPLALLLNGVPFEEMIQQSLSFKKLSCSNEKHSIQDNIHFLQLLESTNLMTPLARPFIYSLFLSVSEAFMNCSYTYPTLMGQLSFLHQDPHVIAAIHGEENVGKRVFSFLAKQRIQSACLQNFASYHCLVEMIKNAKEADASKVDVEVYYDQQSQILTIVLQDNGSGMSSRDLISFRTPGVTTKRKVADNPNFGQGIFSVFANGFSSLTVQTAKEGVCNTLHLEKTREGILEQINNEEETSAASGTTMILCKKTHESPTYLGISIFSSLIDDCKYLTGMEITFNGKPLIQGGERKFFSLEKTCVDALGRPQKVKAEIVPKGSGGIYSKGFKVCDLPTKYLAGLPPFIRESYKKEYMSFSLSIEIAEEVMGRSHLILDPVLESALQKIILETSLRNILE